MFCGKVIGGLGNQMFQISFYSYLAKKIDVEFEIDVSSFKGYRLHQGFEVSRVFDIKLIESTLCEHKCFNEKLYKLQKKIFGKNSYIGRNHFQEEDLPYLLEEGISDFYLEGYFQNFLYTNRELFIFKNQELTEVENKIFMTKQDDRQLVSIHVRGGDFLDARNKSMYSNICDSSYYKSALKLFDEDKYRFLLFTDDKVYASSLLPENSYDVIDWNYGMNSYRDMYLMSLCHHHIISNSTFSWWGAFLSTNRMVEKKVIAPFVWNNLNNSLFNDVIPSHWIKL